MAKNVTEVLFLRNGYNYDRDAVSLECGVGPGEEPARTQQSFAEDADINTIVRRFGLTGQLPNGVAVPQSGDFSGVTDFQSALNLVLDAQAAFLEVPGELRARFNHDPAQFIAFVEDPVNREEAMKLGFITRPVELTRTGEEVPKV